MVSTANGLPGVSADTVERSLAVLLVGLLGLYALGTASSDALPVLDMVGVIAVHFAVVVASVFPLAVLVHGASSQIRTGATGPRRVELATAAVALGCLASALWLALESIAGPTTVLFGCSVGALLVLAGLVAGRP